MTPANQVAPFCDDASKVVLPLRRSLTELIHGRTANEDKQERLLGRLNATLQSRLSRALEAEDDLSALYYMPGPDGLRRVIDAAEHAGHSPELLLRIGACIREYEDFLETEDIGRERLHAVLGGFYPKVRETMMRTNGQAVFKAMSNIIGYYAETMVTCIIVLPGSDPDRCTLVMLRGFRGWRRLRQEAWFLVTGTEAGPIDTDLAITTLDGVSLSEINGPPLISEFCRNAPTFELSKVHGQTRHYTLTDMDIGARSDCDFYMGEVYWNAEQLHADEHRAMSIGFAGVATPCKHMVFDMLVHHDVWPQSSPSLECYRIVPQGIVTEANWADRQHDRLELGVRLRKLAPGLPNIDSPTAPNYRQLAQHAFDQLDVPVDELFGYRVATRYPLYGTQYCMRFELPSRPR